MGMEGAVGEGQGGGRMMSIEWVEYVGNCGAEGGGLDLAVSSARRLQQSSWMDADSVVIALFFCPSRCLPTGVRRRRTISGGLG